MIRKINQLGLDLIKKFEGLKLEAYKDIKGILTIGYGHTGDVVEGQVISRAQADLLLKFDIERTEMALSLICPGTLTDNQFSACVCLAYNIGTGAFGKSTLLKKLNEGKIMEASEQFLRWNKAGGNEVRGLTNRRKAERELFLK